MFDHPRPAGRSGCEPGVVLRTDERPVVVESDDYRAVTTLAGIALSEDALERAVVIQIDQCGRRPYLAVALVGIAFQRHPVPPEPGHLDPLRAHEDLFEAVMIGIAGHGT